MRKIAFTTTIPQEYIWACGAVPVDLNNLFITNNPLNYIKLGEKHGVTRNTCSWIKGLMGVIAEQNKDIEYLIAVTEGDCSNNHGLMNLCRYYFPKLKTISFSYPASRDSIKLEYELKSFGNILGVTFEQAMDFKIKLDEVREKIILLDELFYTKKNICVSDFQKLMVSSSDFGSNVLEYQEKAKEMIKVALQKDSIKNKVTIGYVGVPTIISDLFLYLEEELDVKIGYFEVENDFAMLNKSKDLVDQYIRFNYPYDLLTRINKIKKEIKQRNLKGIIHYSQSFCHRQLDDVIIRESLDVPVLTIEGDAPGELDMRTKIRIECFVERLRDI